MKKRRKEEDKEEEGRGSKRRQRKGGDEGTRKKRRRRKELKLKPLRYKIASNYPKINRPTSLNKPFIKETTIHPSFFHGQTFKGYLGNCVCLFSTRLTTSEPQCFRSPYQGYGSHQILYPSSRGED